MDEYLISRSAKTKRSENGLFARRSSHRKTNRFARRTFPNVNFLESVPRPFDRRTLDLRPTSIALDRDDREEFERSVSHREASTAANRCAEDPSRRNFRSISFSPV